MLAASTARTRSIPSAQTTCSDFPEAPTLAARLASSAFSGILPLLTSQSRLFLAPFQVPLLPAPGFLQCSHRPSVARLLAPAVALLSTWKSPTSLFPGIVCSSLRPQLGLHPQESTCPIPRSLPVPCTLPVTIPTKLFCWESLALNCTACQVSPNHWILISQWFVSARAKSTGAVLVSCSQTAQAGRSGSRA